MSTAMRQPFGSGERRLPRPRRVALRGGGVLATVFVSVLAGGPGARGLPAASAASVRYTVTATFTQYSDTQGSSQSCFWVSLPNAPYGADLVYRCSVDTTYSLTTTSYTAQSTRPFLLRRSGAGTPRFAFTTPMVGTFSRVVYGSDWSRWWIGGVGYSTCKAREGGSARGPVSGTLSLNGGDPAPLRVDAGSPTGQFGTSIRVTSCGGLADQSTTDPIEGVPAEAAQLKPQKLRAAFGHAFTLTDSATITGQVTNPQQNTRSRWTFVFTPVSKRLSGSRWQIDVSGHDRWSWDVLGGLGAGADVDWVHRTTLDIEKNQVVSATAKVSVVRTTPFSEPSGAFAVTATTRTPPAYRPAQATKVGGSVALQLHQARGSQYLLSVSLGPAGPQLLDGLRSIGWPNPDQAYQALVARGRVTDNPAGVVPHSSTLVVPLRPGTYSADAVGVANQLDCHGFGAVQQGCSVTRSGEIISVTRLR